ncbi:hypothetical protein [Hyphomicrobium sp. MC1]|uniref:hypothetical protein n=1 Tax=Hyphomicrobium sp. (strain MC1) TaxID=717785 RepID=UPI000213E453|nr:hypothetical protein [Hyphomicrobium sp. MC1]CCB66505.1 protein of unknown function [Hyphomicrobium sp. MC1]
MPKSQILTDAENWARSGEAISTTMEREPNTTEEQEAEYEARLDFAAALARRAASVGVQDSDCVALVAAILIERDTGWAPSRIAAEANCSQQLGALERHVLAVSICASQSVMAILVRNPTAAQRRLEEDNAQKTARAAVETCGCNTRGFLKLRRVTELGALARKLSSRLSR